MTHAATPTLQQPANGAAAAAPAAVPPATPATPAIPAIDLSAFALLDVPVAWADAQGQLLGANAAFEQATGRPCAAALGRPWTELLGLPAVAAGTLPGTSPLPATARHASGRPLGGQISLRRHAGLQVITLQVVAAAGQAAPVPGPGTGPASDSSLLGLACRLGQLGVWQRDLRTGEGQWDANTWLFWGLTPGQGAPAFDDALRQVHPEDRDEVRALHAPSRNTVGRHAKSFRVQTPGGVLRHVRSVWEVVPGADGQPALAQGVVVDDTARHALHRQLDMAIGATGVGTWSVGLDVKGGGAGLAWQPMQWNAQMHQLHGLLPDQPAPDLQTYLTSLVHPADRAGVTEGLGTLMRRRDGLLDLDYRLQLADGTVRRLATRTSVGGVPGARQLHGVVLDVTERHQTEDLLRQAQQRALLATRGAGIGTWESNADALEGWWDDQMFHLRGLPPRAGPVHTDEMLAWLHPDDRATHARRMREGVRDGLPVTAEFRVVWPDGSVHWLASRSSPVHDALGATTGRVGINWDITDAHNAAAAREERLLARRETQAKSRFLARISHELRTPLNAVLGFSQLLLADDADDDPAVRRRRVQHVQASGEHLLALIDDVLELSSLESGELPLSLQPVALAGLVETSLPLVELLAQARQVHLQLGALGGWALADPVRLRQVLLNLLSNAIKYNRPGGTVTVSTETSAGWLLLRVQDTGRGLDAEQLSHLFEPFNRLGLEAEGIAGTGIGLAIVQASVRQMGGTVQVSSQPGLGSCFEVCLQVATPAPPAAPASELPATPPSAGGRLLYIEDNEVNLLIVSELVRTRSDITFSAAEDGASGLAAALAERPDLILLDMHLPDMDGHEVLRRLRADPVTADIRCIALSANAMPEDIRAARASGFEDYWTKPLDLKVFMRALDRLFASLPCSTG